MYKITKSFDFCYGHRVHNQKLKEEFSLDTCLVCRHLHGHQGKVIVELSSEKLQDGMVTDFKHLGWFKEFLDDHLDHKMILDINDPVLPSIFPQFFTKDKELRLKSGSLVCEEISTNTVVHVVHPEMYNNCSDSLQEVYEGLVFVNFVPTSENLSQWLFEVISERFGSMVTVHSVTFKETPKTSAQYGL